MARHDREDPHSLEEQLAWLDAIKENEEAPVPVTITADDTVVSPYPKDPWAMVPAEPPPPASPLFRAAGDPANGAGQHDDGLAGRGESETREVRPPSAEGLGTGGWTGPLDLPPSRAPDKPAFSAPITAPSEPLSRADTKAEPYPDSSSPTAGAFGERPSPSSGTGTFDRPASSGGGSFGERPSGGAGAFGERPPSGGGAFGERSAPSSGAGAFGERPASPGTGAFGERPASPGTGAFGERSASSGTSAFAAFGERPSSSGAAALGERPAPAGSEGSTDSAGSTGSTGSASSASSTASAPSGKESTGEDTDSFSFGPLTDKPGTAPSSGWLSQDPLGIAKAEPPKPRKEPEPDPEPETTGEQQPVRGWLEAAIPAAESAESAELDAEQERFNAFVAGSDTDDVVVPRVEHGLYEQPAEKTPQPAPPANRQPAAPPASEPPAASAPAAPASAAFAIQGAATHTPSVPSPAPGESLVPDKAPDEREPYRPRRRQTAPTPAQPLQPSFGAPARQQPGAKTAGGKAVAGARQTADSLDPVSLLRGRRNAPAGGWRKIVYKASAGLIKPGESHEVRRRRELVARARTPVASGHHRVAVLSLKGGVGKTTTTVGLGATLASVRGDRVIAVDANPDRGTLSDKVELETSATVRDLLNERQQIKRYVDIRAFTSQATSRLEILASDRDPSVSEAFSAADYQAVSQVLENFYSICLTDCGTGLLHSAMSGVLGLADQLVLVSSPSVDGARAASATLDWLEAHHYADLVKAATVVLCSVRPRSKSTVDLDRLEAHFAARCRAVIRVPYDPHLEEGAEIDLDRLLPATREAYLLLAASVGDGFGGVQGGHF
ncbi:AAA family ATPase [Sphaerisporangium dianthi]|uniref:AAA family ATPase n=1 Tax=Sphaerisporangium dianthi TaxID=1436120 RepID=A0ABV9CE36_9ACTN